MIHENEPYIRNYAFINRIPGMKSGPASLLNLCLSIKEIEEFFGTPVITAKLASDLLNVSLSSIYRWQRFLIKNNLLIKDFYPNVDEFEKWGAKLKPEKG